MFTTKVECTFVSNKIDWLIWENFTPYRQYFSHVTAVSNKNHNGSSQWIFNIIYYCVLLQFAMVLLSSAALTVSFSFFNSLIQLLVLCVNQHSTTGHGFIWLAVPVSLQSNSQTHTYMYSCSIWILFNHIQFIMTLLSKLQPLGWGCGFHSWRHDCAR